MDSLVTQLSGLLLSPGGTISFYIVLSFAVAVSGQWIIINKETTNTSVHKRLLFTNIATLFLLLTLFMVNIYGILAGLDTRLYLPVSERAAVTIGLLLLLWAFSVPHPRKWGIITLIIQLVVLLALIPFTLHRWQMDSSIYYFNHSHGDWIWSIALITILVINLILLMVNRPKNWGVTISAILIPIMAETAHLFLPETNGDFSGYIRFGALFSFAIYPQMIATLLAAQKRLVLPETRQKGITSLNQHLRTLAENNPQTFQGSIPALMMELSQADACYILKDARQAPKMELEPCLIGVDANPSDLTPVVCEPEEIPNLAHALAGQFILTFDKVPGFRDEFRHLGKQLNVFGVPSVLVLPFPIVPEQKTSMILISREKNFWDEVSQAELSTALNALLLILHQKQREEQLQKSIQRILESKQPDFRSIASFNFQELQQNFNQLTHEYEILQEKFNHLQNDLHTITVNMEEITIRSGAPDKLRENIRLLKGWLDQSQTQNSLLRAELEQAIRERQSLMLEIEHFRDQKQVSANVEYLQPQESLPLDAKTNLNETLARSQELLFKITEMNQVVEQNQVQSVVMLESIQEQITNLHQFQRPEETPQDAESFLLQAEYFLEDIRTAQSVLKEQSRLQKMLEESFLNNLKMKDHFDHLAQLNHRNYQKINQIYQELEKNRSKSEEVSLILSNIQEENEKLRATMLEAMAKNTGDTLTIENLQSEMLSAFEEISILKDKIDQKQDMIYQLQLDNELINDGIGENNQILTSLIQDILQPISTINGCINLLSSSLPKDGNELKLMDQIHTSTRTIQGQVSKLIACAQRNDQLVSSSTLNSAGIQTNFRPPAPPEALSNHE